MTRATFEHGWWARVRDAAADGGPDESSSVQSTGVTQPLVHSLSCIITSRDPEISEAVYLAPSPSVGPGLQHELLG